MYLNAESWIHENKYQEASDISSNNSFTLLETVEKSIKITVDFPTRLAPSINKIVLP